MTPLPMQARDHADSVSSTFVCPECKYPNSEDARFCSHCHHVLIYRCPMCWHDQRHGHRCDACHLDLDNHWRVYTATEQSALIQEEATNLEKSARQINRVLATIATLPLRLIPFLEFLGLSLLMAWLRRRIPNL